MDLLKQLQAIADNAMATRASAIESAVKRHAGHAVSLVYRHDAPGVLERVEIVSAYGDVLAHVDAVQRGERVAWEYTARADEAGVN